ncbi:MAG TPA: hypothetical protein VLF40_04945 [Candidatus Saccharimonadales bacterium]|jgi:hypothetical protein|nr:hypothetical protein [Candidatus Saccharimonadales bacterium]
MPVASGVVVGFAANKKPAASDALADAYNPFGLHHIEEGSDDELKFFYVVLATIPSLARGFRS